MLKEKFGEFIYRMVTPLPQQQQQQRKTTLEEQSKEDSEDDGIFSEGDLFFPEEI